MVRRMCLFIFSERQILLIVHLGPVESIYVNVVVSLSSRVPLNGGNETTPDDNCLFE